MVRDVVIHKEIEEIIGEVFGHETMGYYSDQTDKDPFITSDDSDSSDQELPERATVYKPPLQLDETDSNSVIAPDYEDLSDIDSDSLWTCYAYGM